MNNLHARRRKKKTSKIIKSKIIQWGEKWVASSFACSFFILFHCPVFSSKMLSCQAIKRTHVPLSLTYCSEIYTKNVHTWAARNITWHYVSSYENVQNVNVLKNYFAVYSFMFFLKARPKKEKRKKLRQGLSKHNTSFFERTEIRIYNTI